MPCGGPRPCLSSSQALKHCLEAFPPGWKPEEGADNPPGGRRHGTGSPQRSWSRAVLGMHYGQLDNGGTGGQEERTPRALSWKCTTGAAGGVRRPHRAEARWSAMASSVGGTGVPQPLPGNSLLACGDQGSSVYHPPAAHPSAAATPSLPFRSRMAVHTSWQGAGPFSRVSGHFRFPKAPTRSGLRLPPAGAAWPPCPAWRRDIARLTGTTPSAQCQGRLSAKTPLLITAFCSHHLRSGRPNPNFLRVAMATHFTITYTLTPELRD